MKPHDWVSSCTTPAQELSEPSVELCVFLQETSHVFRYTFELSKQKFHCNLSGDPHDTGPLCHQERVSESPSQHDHGDQHCVLPAAADATYERISRVLPRSGPSRIGSETDHATQGFARVLDALLLPGEGSHDSRRSTREPVELVRRNL